MNTSNIYRFNGTDPFDNWTIKNGALYGYYPRNSIINGLSQRNSVLISDKTIIIPNGVMSINGSCFRNNNKYDEIIVPPTINKISDSAFLNSKLVLVVEPGSYIEKYAKRKGLSYRFK